MDFKPVPFVVDVGFKSAGAVELDNGDLLIEGIGANYDIDREDEAFEEGAFSKALSKFLSGNAPLCYHHKYDTVIGRVVDAFPIPGKGIWVKAIVDNQPEGSPWRHIYDGIKKGRINQFSCGGIFKRRQTKAGPRIFEVDLLEWSTTPVPVGRGTKFSVVAGKALQAPAEGKAEGDLTEEETNVVEAAEKEYGERGNDKEVPTTPSPIKPAPEREEEEEVQREEAEEAAEEAKVEVETISAEQIATGAITAEKIAAGSVTTEHLSDDLRSRFQELKPEAEGPKLEDLAAALTKLDSSLDRVAKRVGVSLDQEERETTPTTGPVIMT